MSVTLISFRGKFELFCDLTEVSAQSWYKVHTSHLLSRLSKTVHPVFTIRLVQAWVFQTKERKKKRPLCNTNSDEPLVWTHTPMKRHIYTTTSIYESSYIHRKEQRYWNEDRDSNPNTSSVGPSDFSQLYWGADRNSTNRHYQHHTCKRPLRRHARSLPLGPIQK